MSISALKNDDYDRGWMAGRDSLETVIEPLLPKIEAALVAWRTGQNITLPMQELRQQFEETQV